MKAAEYEMISSQLEDSKTVDEQLAILGKYADVIRNCDSFEEIFSWVADPEDDLTDSDIKKIAKYVRTTFGPYVIGVETSYWAERIITLLDDISISYKEEGKYRFTFCRLESALRKEGILYGRECDELDLYYEFCTISYPQTNNTINKLFNYPYKMMRSNRSPIKEGLAMYLYHPDRIRDWLAKNPDKHVEDYEP